ncbi:hypothetical protein B0H13DRAFT_1935164 [Mycena leptocephala]|nr:hypothetical protein B0H13DRAFT_1935164 [Mycena leptocephala]
MKKKKDLPEPRTQAQCAPASRALGTDKNKCGACKNRTPCHPPQDSSTELRTQSLERGEVGPIVDELGAGTGLSGTEEEWCQSKAQHETARRAKVKISLFDQMGCSKNASHPTPHTNAVLGASSRIYTPPLPGAATYTINPKSKFFFRLRRPTEWTTTSAGPEAFHDAQTDGSENKEREDEGGRKRMEDRAGWGAGRKMY